MDYTDAMYGGAPDECNLHWPVKIEDGVCPECERAGPEVLSAQDDLDGSVYGTSMADHRELRFARTPGGEARLVMTVGGPASGPSPVPVMLVHAFTDLACDSDLIVEPSDAEVPYPVVIQTDLLGTVKLDQLGPVIGTISNRVLAEADSGFRLQGPGDGRWGFKQEEGRQFRRITLGLSDV